jgi:signal transduction histidine kinase
MKWNECFTLSNLTKESLLKSVDDNIEMEFTLDNDRGSRHLLLAVSKVINESGEIDGFISVISDITRLKELEVATSRRERLSEMGDLAAGVAHEIRNPLNSISIASQRLAAEFTTHENQDEFISFTKQIKDETKRLNEIITRFLALTREDKSKQQKFNLSETINDFIKFITPETNQYNIEIKSDIVNNIYIKGNSDSIKQVLSNLFNNSREAISDKNGTIQIRIYLNNKKVEVEFEDSGCGIPEDLHVKVFAPYYTTKEAGTGLGLPTVHRIVTEMDGDVKIKSSSLGGAKFVMTFNSL